MIRLVLLDLSQADSEQIEALVAVKKRMALFGAAEKRHCGGSKEVKVTP